MASLVRERFNGLQHVKVLRPLLDSRKPISMQNLVVTRESILVC